MGQAGRDTATTEGGQDSWLSRVIRRPKRHPSAAVIFVFVSSVAGGSGSKIRPRRTNRVAKNPWKGPKQGEGPWSQPKKKADSGKPVESRKATYDEKSIFGGSHHSEGREAKKNSKNHKW